MTLVLTLLRNRQDPYELKSSQSNTVRSCLRKLKKKKKSIAHISNCFKELHTQMFEVWLDYCSQMRNITATNENIIYVGLNYTLGEHKYE